MDDKRINNQKYEKETVENSENNDLDTEYLVSRAIGGDVQAFGKLYTSHVTRIYRYAFYNVRHKQHAEDITQEVFLKAWKAIKSCKGKEKTFSSWLYRIAHNLIIDKIRKRQRELSGVTEIATDIIDTSSNLEAGLEKKDLLKEMDYLPSNQRQVIILKFIQGMDNREIAEIMGKSTGAIRIMQMRALTALKDRLNREQR
jgi:RNA polymerase sigma-70 factor (ECF subfamily)